MKKIKILYLITGLNPGGAEMMLKKIIYNLDKDQFDVYVCVISKMGLVAEMIRPHVKNIYFLDANTISSRIKATIKLRKLILQLKPHVLHCFMIHSNLLGRISSIGLNCATISSIRVKLLEKKYIPLILLDLITQRLVNCYLVNSKSLYNHILRLKIKKQKIFLIENGIELNKLKPKEPSKKLINELNLPNLPVISMIAHFRKQKDYPTMITALFHLEKEIDFNFLAVGTTDISVNVANDVSRLIQEFKLKNVKILGLRDDVPEILSITDVWVSSTLFEGQSNSLLEAMAMKVPIVTTNIPENAEVVRDGKEALLVPVKDPKRIAQGIKKLINDKEYSKKLAENAYKRVHNAYDINKTMKKLSNLYNSLIN